ncbi:MAG: hypothetical protein B7Y37_14180 [Sphingobacteriia bacterium 28-36-52]|nr:MAG: hypothetical protein B7Y37_14180 [Sphingobacteriia bacterium 28-36-52]
MYQFIYYVTDLGFAVPPPPPPPLFKILLNPATTFYLRGLQRDLGVSSNTVRLELNKLTDMKLIKAQSDLLVSSTSTRTKYYTVNTKHPLFNSLRGLILQYVGLDQIIEHVLDKLGDLDKVYLTGDLALGNNSPFVDLVLVGSIDKSYLYRLIEKAEIVISKKIRIALYQPNEFTENTLKEVGVFMKLMG